MKPIKQQKKDAEKLFIDAERELSEVSKQKESLNEREEELIERTGLIIDREQVIQETEDDLSSRQEILQKQEKATGNSVDKLNKSWVEFHNEVNETNSKIKQQRLIIETGRKTNEVFAESLKEKSDDLENRDRQIQDKYQTLQRALEEFNKKKNG